MTKKNSAPSQLISVVNKLIGSERTFIIAEIGSNHNQSLELAYQSIDAAIEAGADAVKFQSLNAKELYYNPSDEIIKLHTKIDLEENWHYLLNDYCSKKDILFFSSPTYLKSIEILEDLNVPLYKLASAQIGTFPQLVRKVAQTGKPVIFSTGIVSYAELERVVNIFTEEGNSKYIILHCNSLYPTPYDQVNLQLMDTYKQMFGCIVGFSDHTDGIYVPIGAVARGAKVIEKHFALSRSLPVPDAAYSLEPDEFKAMVKGIRAVEQSCGISYRSEILPKENEFKQKILYRLIINKDKKKGDIVTSEDYQYLRSPFGIDCREKKAMTKQLAARDMAAGEILKLADLIDLSE